LAEKRISDLTILIQAAYCFRQEEILRVDGDKRSVEWGNAQRGSCIPRPEL
jgi:hypothetical protein